MRDVEEPRAAGTDGPGQDAKPPSIPARRYDLRILQGLRKIIRGIHLHSRRLAGTHGITAPQLICLVTIAADGPLTIKQIAHRVFLSPSTVVGILDRLEGKGLVLRTRSTQDRRVVNVTTTAAGSELAESAPSPLQDDLARELKKLPEIEQATIASSLQRIVDLMDVEDVKAAPLLETSSSLSSEVGVDSAFADERTQEQEPEREPERGIGS